MEDDSTHALPPTPSKARPLGVRVAEGPDSGSVFVVEQSAIIGTSERADIRLSDRTVSRRHASVTRTGVGLRVVDEGSRNGTWLGAARVHDVELGTGGELRVGATVLVVEELPSAESAPTASARPPTAARFGRFLGGSRAMLPRLAELERAAATDLTVLLEGESGVGKELLAEAVHEQSRRRDGPFVVVDCGSIPATLIESELFGHEKGAFTGADRARRGAFEEANGGTVFLDEVGELPLPLQTRLLRVLDQRTVRPLGGDRRVEIDVRVVAATNRNLERAVEDSRFRLDLFHRLAVVLVRIPPLRDRLDDLPLLARDLVRRAGGDPDTVLDADTLASMTRHAWPGNVRELRNYVERLVLLGSSAITAAPSSVDPLREAATSDQPYGAARARVVDAFTELYVEHMLRRHGGNVSRAADAAGVARRHFQRLKKKE